MSPNRLEAFSDGVLAILITIMVLGLKTPDGPTWSSLSAVLPSFLAYVMSFVFIGIYWNNHHHLIKTVSRVTGSMMWANLALLLCLSFIPYFTQWLAQDFATVPVAVYGIDLLACAATFFWLQLIIVRSEGTNSGLATALGSVWKERVSLSLYVAGVALSFFWPYVAVSLYALVAVMWLIPDRRLERLLQSDEWSSGHLESE